MSRARDNANLSPTIPDARMPNLTGDVTTVEGAVATTIATDAVDIAMLSATGTASATTFLRGDNAWAVASTAKPILFATIDDSETFADGADTTAVWNTPTINNLGTWTASTDQKWSPSVAGIYFVTSEIQIRSDGVDKIQHFTVPIYKNASIIARTAIDTRNAGLIYQVGSTASTIVSMDGTSGDYLWVRPYYNNYADSTAAIILHGNFCCWLIEAT